MASLQLRQRQLLHDKSSLEAQCTRLQARVAEPHALEAPATADAAVQASEAVSCSHAATQAPEGAGVEGAAVFSPEVTARDMAPVAALSPVVAPVMLLSPLDAPVPQATPGDDAPVMTPDSASLQLPSPAASLEPIGGHWGPTPMARKASTPTVEVPDEALLAESPTFSILAPTYETKGAVERRTRVLRHRPIYCECHRPTCRACSTSRPSQAPIPLLSPTVVDSPAGTKDDDLQRMMDRFNFAVKGGSRGRTATLINMWRVQGGGKVAPKAMPDAHEGGAVQVPAPPMVHGCFWSMRASSIHAQGQGQLDAMSRIPSGKVQLVRAAWQSRQPQVRRWRCQVVPHT